MNLKISRLSLYYLLVAVIALVCSADTALAQGNTLVASPLSVTFSTAFGTPQPQNIFVTTSSTGSLTFTATATSTNNWLGIFVGGTTTPASIQAFVQNTNLPTGSYAGTITLTPTGGGAAVVINATLNVGTSTVVTISADKNPVTFSVPSGTTTSSQTVTLNSNAGLSSAALTAQTNVGTGWLSVSPNTILVGSGSPATIQITVAPGLLQPNTYTGSVNVTLQGAATPALSLPVTLVVGQGTSTGALAANPTSLTYAFATSTSQSQTQISQITTTSNVFITGTATASVTAGSGWLSVIPANFSVNSSFPTALSITVTPSGLNAGANYTGSVLVTTSDGSTVTIPVNATVGTVANALTATPNPITASIPLGVTTPTNINLAVNIASGSTFFTASTSGLSWISVNQPTASVTNGTATNLIVSISPPSGITSGVYSGNIVLTPQSGAAISIPVNVTIGGAASITLSPIALNFAYQSGTAFPTAQSVSVTSSGSTPVAFSVSPTTSNGGSWLVVTPQSSVTASSGNPPTTLSVSVNPSGLPSGTYSGSITVNAPGAANSPQSIPITLLVSSNPILQLDKPTVSFNYQFGSTTLPSQQQVQVTSSGNPLSFNVSTAPGSGGNWLQASPTSGTTNQTLNLSVNPLVLSTLAPGTYNSSVTLTSNAAGNSPVTIPVSLTIGSTTLLNVSQTSLSFNYQNSKGLPATQTIGVSSSGSPLSYTVTAASSNCGGNFLSATPSTGTTPGTIAVAVNVQGVVNGTCTGTLTITPQNTGGSPTVIPVALHVSDTPLLNVSPSAVNLTSQVGTLPASLSISLTSTDPAVSLPFNVTSTTDNGGTWLLVGPTSGTTPNNLTIAFQVGGLPIGTYTGSITVTPTTAGISPVTIPVTVVITTSTTASTTPASLTFSQPFGGSTAAAQTLQIASTNTGLTFAASATTFNGGNGWLTVTPSSGTTPGSVSVTANGSNLGQGSYSGVVTIVIPGASNTPINVPVTLNITSPQSLQVAPNQLSFTYQAGSGTTPAAQNLQVTAAGGSLAFNASATSSISNLLTVSPTTGSTPGTVAVTLNQTAISGLAAGTYTGSVLIQSGAGSFTVPVTLTVTAAAAPSLTTLVNSASNQAGVIAPGEIVTLYGSNIGPATPQGLQLTSSGNVATTLGNTIVTFDGIPAPLIYVSTGQINAIVPYEIGGRVTTSVVVQRNGVSSNTIQYQVVPTVPAIFSADQTGNNQGAILNSNNTYNSSTTPAAKGSVIQIYATGEGALRPAVTTGSVTSSTGPTFPVPVGGVSVTIGGQIAQVVYAGEAPGLVSGALQVNAIVPSNIASGPQTIVLTVGNSSNTQQNITVAVQ